MEMPRGITPGAPGEASSTTSILPGQDRARTDPESRWWAEKAQALTALDLGQFVRRIFQDALTEATASFWERRAKVFEWAAPRVGDYMGRASLAELTESLRRCNCDAARCRVHAHLLRGGGATDPQIAEYVTLILGSRWSA